MLVGTTSLFIKKVMQKHIKDIQDGKAIAGTKQVLKGLENGSFSYIIMAKDTDEFLKEKFNKYLKNTKVVYVESKQHLGELCHLSVHCAVVGIKK